MNAEYKVLKKVKDVTLYGVIKNCDVVGFLIKKPTHDDKLILCYTDAVAYFNKKTSEENAK